MWGVKIFSKNKGIEVVITEKSALNLSCKQLFIYLFFKSLQISAQVIVMTDPHKKGSAVSIWKPNTSLI